MNDMTTLQYLAHFETFYLCLLCALGGAAVGYGLPRMLAQRRQRRTREGSPP